MASHRKPRNRVLQSASTRRGALGVTTAALATVSLLSATAHAAPGDGKGGAKPSVEEVQKKVDSLYRQAESATQKYDAAKEKTDAQRAKVDRSLDQVARRTAKLNDARRTLGNFATAQYRNGGMSDTATLLLSDDPQSYFQQTHLLDRMSGREKQAVSDFEDEQRSADKKRDAASRDLSALASSQQALSSKKHEVRAKLSEARKLLSHLTAEQKARMAAVERKKQAAARKAAERAEAQREAAAGKQHTGGSGGSSTAPASSRASKVIAFAKAQLGKPYVWGATGPNSYDCSGLTQDAWKAAGISLPRTTFDQVDVGTPVPKSQMKPGDLVFFYKDVSHVGIYVGNGQMIHAPKPGADVTYENVSYMPFHSAVRPG